MSVDSTIGEEMERSVSYDVVEEVAAIRDVPAQELEPLYSVIDPDALESLFTGGDVSGYVQFDYEGCTVQANSEGEILVSKVESA